VAAMTTLRVTVDSAPAQTLITRVRDAAAEALAEARSDGQELTTEAAVDTALSAALTAILRVRSAHEDAEAELARLREGEEPYCDERVVPTAAQWVWLWNQASPAERLQRAQRVLDDAEKARHLYFLRFQDGGPAEAGTPLCTAYWDTPDHDRVHCWRGVSHEPSDFHMGETAGGVRYQWRDGVAGTVPHGEPKPRPDCQTTEFTP
jgi:hypothetical protein